MADASVFSTARTSLRETFKWFGASIAAFATLAASGLSWSILPEIDPSRLNEALGYCALLVGAVVAALFVMLSVLSVRPFPRSKWAGTTNFDSDIDKHTEIFKGKFASMGAFRSAYNSNDQDAKSLASDVTDFVALLDLERASRRAAIALVALFLAGCFAVYSLVSLKISTSKGVAVVLTPGEGWTGVSRILNDRCGDDPLPASGVADDPFAGWWTVSSTGERCKGLRISVPGQGLIAVAPE